MIGSLLAALLTATPSQDARKVDFSTLTPQAADAKKIRVADGKATITGDGWTYLATPGEHRDVEAEAAFTIQEPARHSGYFGQHWSVWPDLTYGDGGFEASLLLRAGRETGYRVQLSHRLQELALVKFPDGGYLQVVPCVVKLKEPHRVSAAVQGDRIVVRVDGQEKIRYQDDLRTIATGKAGLGGSGGAHVVFHEFSLKPLASAAPANGPKARHAPNFRVRKWLGGRPWVFDGNEPILLLPTPESTYVNNVKLRPGFKPLLSWNSHWDVQTQGAFKEADNAFANDLATTGGGAALTARWSFRHVKNRFVVRTTMTVGYDDRRAVYAYDIDSELEVLPGEPFAFRYGYDFEHHTPLDPFRWQYLVFRRQGGQVNHRPVYPIDPGPQYDLEGAGGLRVWYGRHTNDFTVAPAVEYSLPDAGKRKLAMAVCAAFYDTGIGYASETAPAGTKVRVTYRYTGWPAEEAEQLFRKSTIYESLTLDPAHHYLFAENWPKVTFDKFVPMSKTWIYGRRPFMTAHNHRPTYELAQGTGAGTGFAMKLGPGAFGATDLPLPGTLPKGRYVVSALVKSANAHGPGGRIELQAKEAKGGKVTRAETHYVGNGTWEWKKVAFLSEVPSEAQALSLGLRNPGTGDVLVAEVEFTRLEDGAPAPAGALPQANAHPPKTDAAPACAIADYRMEEGKGLHVMDYAWGPLGVLELANPEWTTDAGRSALRFAENPSGRREYPKAGWLDRSYLRHPGYAGRDTLPVAVAGQHGGGSEYKGLTISTWVKPAAQMPRRRADVVGFGARRFILTLEGHQPPYRPVAVINVNDRIEAGAALEADRWYSLAMTAEATPEKKWRVRVYVDGAKVGEGVAQKYEAPASVPPSLVLGTELFYFHDCYYRGLIGRTTLYDRALGEEDLRRFTGAK